MPIPILVSAALALATEFAPTLIRHFAGDKAGDIATTVASTAKVLTGQDITTPEGLQAAQESLRKDKELSVQFQIRMAEIDLDTEKAYLADRQSARQREVEVAKATGQKDTNLYVLAWTVVLLFFALTGFLMFQTVPEANIGPVNQLFGAMATGFGMVLSYFFGSSKSSADKTKIMANGK